MAATSARGTDTGTDKYIVYQDAAPAPASTLGNAAVSTPHLAILSLASTESLIGRSMGDFHLTPMSDLLATPDTSDIGNHTTPHSPADLPAFSNMLSRGLTQTAAQMTSAIHADLQHIGAQIEHIENKTDQSTARINQNTVRIQHIQDQLEMALFKIDDLENRSRHTTLESRASVVPWGPQSVNGGPYGFGIHWWDCRSPGK